jgi:hypothetical protein
MIAQPHADPPPEDDAPTTTPAQETIREWIDRHLAEEEAAPGETPGSPSSR